MENKSEIVNNLLCMACLCVGRSIHEVKNEKLKKYYLDTLNEIPLNKVGLIVPIICWECEAILHKVVAFKEQVKDSYRILQTYSENLNECLLSDVSRAPRLKVHRNNPVDIPSDIESQAILRSESNVSEYSDAEEHIQTVTCDPKRNRRKKKNSQNDKLAKNRIQNVEKVDVEVEDVKMEVHKDVNTINSNAVSKNGGMENILKVEEESENIKYFENVNKVLEIQMDDVKMELDNKDESLAEDNVISDSDLDIDNEIQSFLDNAKKSNKTKSKKKTVSNSIITLDLSYDEMQAERSKSMEKESFLQAKFKCESCILVFNSSSSLKCHQAKKHAVKGDFICSICKTIISSVEAFTAHYKRHMRRYECPTCGKRTTDIKAMHRHIYTKHDVSLKKYQCNICGKVSNSLDTHRYHRDTHKARVECSQCDKTFSHRAGLMNHRLAVHELQNEFPCTVCSKVFRWKTSLKRHFEKHDNENKGENTQNRAFCTSCNIGFSSVCSLQRHLRNSLKHVTHDQLKFICDHCKQRFADKTKLRDHIEEKHLHRTFQCPICNKPSKNRVGLEQHIRAVHKGRPNNRMCHHCGKGFPTKVQLESHIRTHTGERPFMCEFCPTTFSQQSNLYKHHRQVHLNIKTKRYLCKKRKLEGSQTDPQFTLPIIQYLPDNEFILGNI